jgi:hypothetical protein
MMMMMMGKFGMSEPLSEECGTDAENWSGEPFESECVNFQTKGTYWEVRDFAKCLHRA